MTERRWAAYPTAIVYNDDTGKETKDALLWGREFEVLGTTSNGRVPVGIPKVLPEASSTVNGNPRKPRGWIPVDQIVDKPVLEIVFVDIGQGDGCVMVTPDQKHIVIDAGIGDNMHRFLKWRFGRNFELAKPFHVVISHSDEDHYGGFRHLFTANGFAVDTVYHNGLVERKAAAKNDSLGARQPAGDATLVVDLVQDDAEMFAILDNDALVKGKEYPSMLRKAREKGAHFRSLGIERGGGRRYYPGFGTSQPLSIEILGPVIETIQGTKGLRWFKDPGKTKNGHSVVLKLVFDKVSILLGGDLNTLSERLLLEAHTGLPYPGNGDEAAEKEMIEAARKVFECDIAKACHHGAADFSDRFLKSINPIATVVSSGDEESYAHPRPDALGAYGICGRGIRPLLFSTELARSSAERIKYPAQFRAKIADIMNQFAAANVAGDEAKIDGARARFNKEMLNVERSVSTYGAINVRTDGERVLIAYKIEKPRSPGEKWDLYRLEPDDSGRLRHVPKKYE